MRIQSDSSSEGAAVEWIKAILLGPAATSVAILSIAMVGVLMLGGRLPIRRGATVIVGCFIVFSAVAIAEGIVGFVAGDIQPPPPVAVPEPTYTPSVKAPSSDPFAGAAVPQ